MTAEPMPLPGVGDMPTHEGDLKVESHGFEPFPEIGGPGLRSIVFPPFRRMSRT